MLAFAATLDTVINKIGTLVGLIIPILIAVALLVFIVGVIKYITAGADEEKRKEARNTIIYGIIGLFAIVSVWGLVNILQSTFGITETSITPPQFKF